MRPRPDGAQTRPRRNSIAKARKQLPIRPSTDVVPTCAVGPIELRGHNIAVIKLKNSTCRDIACLAYCISFARNESGRALPVQRFIVQERLAKRLYARYVRARSEATRNKTTLATSMARNECSCDEFEESGHGGANVCEIVGYRSNDFLAELCCAVSRKAVDRFNLNARTVTPDFYALW